MKIVDKNILVYDLGKNFVRYVRQHCTSHETRMKSIEAVLPQQSHFEVPRTNAIFSILGF